jgi:hypothetical protein
VGNFFVQTIKIRSENDGIFGWGFLIWMPVGTKHVLSADRLFFMQVLAVVGVFIQFQDFPSCFGVNDSMEHEACSVANACLCRGYTTVKISATSVDKL